MIETLLVILSMIGAIAVALIIIAGCWYLVIQRFKEEEKDIYEVIYITKEQLTLMNENQMIELIINNKKVIIKLY